MFQSRYKVVFVTLMANQTFSNSLKALMPSNHAISGLSTPRLHHLSKKTFVNFDIFKKGLDLGKDAIRSHIHLIQKLDRYFPLLGLLIGLIGLSLQLLIIIFDKQHSRTTKIAASVIFCLLISIAISACLLAVKAPILSGALGIAISFITFLSDGYQFSLNIKKLFSLKKRRQRINELNYRDEKLLRLNELSQKQTQLYAQLKVELNRLLKESAKDNNQDAYTKQLRQTNNLKQSPFQLYH